MASNGTDNEITIVVRARSSVRQGFDAARKEAELAGTDAGQDYTRKFGETVTMRLRERMAAPMATVGKEMGGILGQHAAVGMAQVIAKGIAAVPGQSKDETETAGNQIGQDIGDSAGRSLVQRFKEYIRSIQSSARDILGRFPGGSNTGRGGDGRDGGDGSSDRGMGSGGLDKDVDKDRRSLLGRFLSWGKDAAKAFSQGFASAVSTFFSGDLISVLLKVLAGGALAAALGPAIGAAISAAILLALGGGIIAAGIAGAFKDPRIQGAASELGDKLGKMFAKFGEPFRGPVATFLEKFDGFLDRIAPKLQKISEKFAPLVDKLGQGLIEALDNMMPGILKAMEDSAPLIETLARHLPDIGKALGFFFEKISENGDDANQFFSDLLSIIEAVIKVLGVVISTLAFLYSVVRDTIGGAIIFFEGWWTSVKEIVNRIKGAFRSFKEYALNEVQKLLNGAAAALSWIPGIGPKLKAAQQKFAEFRSGANKELGKIRDREVSVTIKTFGMVALQAAADLARRLAEQGYAHGGIIGAAASGGMRSGLTMVGERGRELIDAAPGTRVHSNEDTERMLAGSGGGMRAVTARWIESGDALMDVLAKYIRIDVQRNGGGSVQATYGQAR